SASTSINCARWTARYGAPKRASPSAPKVCEKSTCPSSQRRNSHATSNGTATSRSASPSPSRCNSRTALGAIWMPAPISASDRRRSNKRTSPTPARKRKRAAERPPNPPPAMPTRMPETYPPGHEFTAGRLQRGLRNRRRERERHHLAVAAPGQRLRRPDRLLEPDRHRAQADRRREGHQAHACARGLAQRLVRAARRGPFRRTGLERLRQERRLVDQVA